jgi:lipopolysaccharide biosynthesis glycosyltransferase
MKWFFALNEHGNEFENYSKLLKVAVHTAQKFTTLEPHFLYDGEENSLTDWLRKRDVTIVKCRSFLYDNLRDLAERKNNPYYFTIGTGAFLRTEIPRLALENGYQDEFVLYTDLDVMFMTEVVETLQKFSPKYFAVAPEITISDYRAMNSGVMLMNLKNLQADDAKFRKFIFSELEKMVGDAWDQTAYKMFYRGRIFGYKWDKLPPELNWKPYWGDYLNAQIIHFHGPKPFQKEILLSDSEGKEPESLFLLLEGKFLELADIWEQFYRETL